VTVVPGRIDDSIRVGWCLVGLYLVTFVDVRGVPCLTQKSFAKE
jgi:hypothetical protein